MFADAAHVATSLCGAATTDFRRPPRKAIVRSAVGAAARPFDATRTNPESGSLAGTLGPEIAVDAGAQPIGDADLTLAAAMGYGRLPRDGSGPGHHADGAGVRGLSCR